MTHLAAFIDGLAADHGVALAARDRDFVRRVARALHAARHTCRVAEADALGLTAVTATLRMARRGGGEPEVALVVTGQRRVSGAEVTLRWPADAFDRVVLGDASTAARHAGDATDARDVSDPPTWASLDHGPAGESAWLLRDVADLVAGTSVRIRAVATIGDVAELRAMTTEGPRTIPLAAVTWTH